MCEKRTYSWSQYINQMVESVDSEAVLKIIEANPVSHERRVSIGTLLSIVACLHELSKNIRNFFVHVTVWVLQYGCNIWILTKSLEKK